MSDTPITDLAKRWADTVPYARLDINGNPIKWTRNELINALSRIKDELDGCFDPEAEEEDSIATAHEIARTFAATPMDQPEDGPIRLTRSHWEEIAAAVWSKRTAILAGRLGDEDEPGQDAAWVRDLDEISALIGPDGQEALKRGVGGAA